MMENIVRKEICTKKKIKLRNESEEKVEIFVEPLGHTAVLSPNEVVYISNFEQIIGEPLEITITKYFDRINVCFYSAGDTSAILEKET